MQKNMKQRYHVFLRPWGVYYCEDLTTKKQETLKTRDKDEAYRLVWLSVFQQCIQRRQRFSVLVRSYALSHPETNGKF